MNPLTKVALKNAIRLEIYASVGMRYVPTATPGVFHCGVWSFPFLWVVSNECFMSAFSLPYFSSWNLNQFWVTLGVLWFPAPCPPHNMEHCWSAMVKDPPEDHGSLYHDLLTILPSVWRVVLTWFPRLLHTKRKIALPLLTSFSLSPPSQGWFNLLLPGALLW